MQEILEKLDKIESLIKGKTEEPLSFVEGAAYLNLSLSYLYKLTSTRQIPHWKPLGKRIFFSKSELDAWIFRNPVKTIAAIEQEAADYVVAVGGQRRHE